MAELVQRRDALSVPLHCCRCRWAPRVDRDSHYRRTPSPSTCDTDSSRGGVARGAAVDDGLHVASRCNTGRWTATQGGGDCMGSDSLWRTATGRM